MPISSVLKARLGWLPRLGLVGMLVGCTSQIEPPDGDDGPSPLDPETAPRAIIDRFSAEAGTMMVRDETNGLPGANEPIDFDQEPFITTGFGPGGEIVRYYNFDVQPASARPIYVLHRKDEDEDVPGQGNIVDAIPGETDYSDFWQLHRVTVPSDYVANTVTSLEAIIAGGFPVEPSDTVVNCPIVPEGSLARLRLYEGSPELIQGWYRDQVVHFFTFIENVFVVDLSTEGPPPVPFADIFVCFNLNPGEAGGGPASGACKEPSTDQTHNVLGALPSEAGYSPLWFMNVYDNADFDSVRDLASTTAATLLPIDLTLANCPVVAIDAP